MGGRASEVDDRERERERERERDRESEREREREDSIQSVSQKDRQTERHGGGGNYHRLQHEAMGRGGGQTAYQSKSSPDCSPPYRRLHRSFIPHRRAQHAHQLEREGRGGEHGVDEVQTLVGARLQLHEHGPQGGAPQQRRGCPNVGQLGQDAGYYVHL